MKYSDKLTSSQSRKALTLLLCIMAAGGIIAGSIYGAAAGGQPPVWLHQYFLPSGREVPVLEQMRNTILSSGLFIAAVYLMGLSAFGQPVGAAMIVFRGFGIGLASALLYSEYGSSALPKVVILLMPKALAVTFISVIAVRELMRASGCVLKLWVYGEVVDERIVDLKRYSLKFAVLLLLSLLITLADGAVSMIYSKLS